MVSTHTQTWRRTGDADPGEHKVQSAQAESVCQSPEESFAADKHTCRHCRGEDVTQNHGRAEATHRANHGTTRMDDDLGNQKQSDYLACGQLTAAQQKGNEENGGGYGADHLTWRDFPAAETVARNGKDESGEGSGK